MLGEIVTGGNNDSLSPLPAPQFSKKKLWDEDLSLPSKTKRETTFWQVLQCEACKKNQADCITVYMYSVQYCV